MSKIDQQPNIVAAQAASLEPEEFQVRLIDNLTTTLLRENAPPCVLRAPTGSGKTFILSRVLQNVSNESPTIWFWFVPFVNLVQQTEDTLAQNTSTLIPLPLARGRNQDPCPGMVAISTAQAVARARSRNEGYTDGVDDDRRSLDQMVALARARGIKIGLLVDEAHIGLDTQTEFGRFAHWLDADRIVMATATPKDQRLNDFLASAGYTAYEAFVASRDEVVRARLNKRYIEAVVYDLRQSMQTITDLELTVLRQAWRRNQKIKKELQLAGIPVVPLLLVQVANGANAIETARNALIRLCHVHPGSIGEHSADAPDPVLMAGIANDSTKEVLIFKQSAGTGFDAPRAFVLASTKPVNDQDFAMQFIGRIMRVHRAVRAHFRRRTRIAPDLDTAYVYLASAQAQVGFEQAVSATAGMRSELEGLTEKLVIRQTASGAIHLSNRSDEQDELFYRQEPFATPATAGPTHPSAPQADTGLTRSLFDDAPSGGEDAAAEPTTQEDELDLPDHSQPRQSRDAQKLPATEEELVGRLADAGLRAYSIRRSLKRVPRALRAEERPILQDMAEASRTAAARLEIDDDVRRTAVRVALGRITEVERHTELTTSAVTSVEVAVVVDRTGLANEARGILARLPQVEDADSKIIVSVLASRLESYVREEHAHEEEPPLEADIHRQARDAAYWVIRKCFADLEEALHGAIAARARYVEADPLPDLLIYPDQQPLESSPKNLYGVLPPSKDSFNQLAQVVPIEVRDRLQPATLMIGERQVYLAPYDGGHVLGHEERSFAHALDLAPFVHWWHRNPDRKPYSVRLVRGEHRNYFYPDFVVCVEHFPGDEALIRLVETKESTKDAARKARHAPPLYGRVLFLTKDMSRLRWINEDGTLGSVVDMDNLSSMREWLLATRPEGQNLFF
jgi:type III restriction enzyme